ncbi:MAG: phosphatase PAP2 family protein [Thermodesulfovibrio sp.]|nr:phosphatase PAP2 family protein [Thermodesulfovibrio sp.]
MIKEFLKLQPSFQLNIIFFLILFLLVIFSYAEIPTAFNFLIIYLSMAIFQFFICQLNNNKFINLIKNILFPVFSVLIAFDTIGEIIPYINKDMDHVFLEIDYKIFGFYPYLYLEKFATPYLTEIMQLSYCVYYFLPFMLGIYLLRYGNQQDFQRALFLVLLCFYFSYIGYLIFPALGPRFSIAHMFQNELHGILVANHINNILNSLEGIKRDAFPSGHVGISLLILLMFYKYNKKIFWIFVFPVILLIISTVYCRYHYFIDVIGGMILTVVTLLIGNLYYNFWLTKNGNSSHKG